MRFIYYTLSLAIRSLATIFVMIVFSASVVAFIQIQLHEPLWSADAIRSSMPDDIVLGRNYLVIWSPDCLIAEFEWRGRISSIEKRVLLKDLYKIYDDSLGSDWNTDNNEHIISDLNYCYRNFRKKTKTKNEIQLSIPKYLFNSDNATDMMWSLKDDKKISKYSFMSTRGMVVIVIIENTAILIM